MNFANIADFLAHGVSALVPGPIAILLMEDLSETNSTIRHHQKLGFANILVFGPDSLKISAELHPQIQVITCDLTADDALENTINPLIEALPETWLYYCYNAEYLFYPFCESRSIGELVAFATEERRASILTYVIDLYADDLAIFEDGVSLKQAHLDQSGYYAQTRSFGEYSEPLERQFDIFGGLRWRYEEHVPSYARKIDRIGLFCAEPGLKIRANHTFNIEEFNTYACPWHNNVTADICSFRAAKSLKSNPGSSFEIDSFYWHNSRKFAWHSQQLLELGLMEPGQWF